MAPAAADSEDEFVSLTEAARRLGVHYMTAYRYVRTGVLEGELTGARWMVRAGDIAALRSPEPARPAPRPPGTGRLVGRLVAGDEPACWAMIETSLASGSEPAAVYVEMVAPAMAAIGAKWQTGELTVADEHRATEVALRLVGRLGPRFYRRGLSRGTVVVSCVQGERHALPAAMLSDILRGAGWKVENLGADPPVESFVETACAADRLAAVMVGATMDGRHEAIEATVAALRAGGVAAPVLIGGRGTAQGDARRLGADAWSGRDARAALRSLEDLGGPDD